MEYLDIAHAIFGAAAIASLVCLGLVETDKQDGKTRLKMDTALVDMVSLSAIATFVAIMVAYHPEWVA